MKAEKNDRDRGKSKGARPVGGHPCFLKTPSPEEGGGQVDWTEGSSRSSGDLSILLFMLLNAFPKQIEDLTAHGASLIGRHVLEFIVKFPVHSNTQMFFDVQSALPPFTCCFKA